MSTLNGGPGNIVTNGLVLYLDAANYLSYVSGSTTWRDLSSSNLSGSLINGPTYNSGNAGSIVFDGTNDTTGLGNILNIGLSSWTISCWFKINSYTSEIQGIMGKTSARSYVGRYTLFIENGFLNGLLQAESGGNYAISASVTPYNDSKWHNAVLSIDRTQNMTLYMDTNNISATSVSASINVNLTGSTDNLYIGSYGRSDGIAPLYFFNGNISTAQIYNRALTTSEVLQNYNATKGRFGL
jgi:hypothetical protein